VNLKSTVLGAPSASVAALETPTVATFCAAFIVEPPRRLAGTTADGVHGREFVGNVAQHGVVTREQLLNISIVIIIIIIIIIMQRLTRHVSVIRLTNRRRIRYRLAQTAGREQMPNLAAVNSPPAARQSFGGSRYRVRGGQAADDKRMV